MSKKHLTSKVLDQHTHAWASVQSDQGLWGFTSFIWNIKRRPKKKTYDQQSSRSACAYVSAQFEQESLQKKKKKKKKKNT